MHHCGEPCQLRTRIGREPDKVDRVGQPQFARKCAHLRRVLVLAEQRCADDPKARAWMICADESSRSQKDILPLRGADPPQHADHRRARRRLARKAEGIHHDAWISQGPMPQRRQGLPGSPGIDYHMVRDVPRQPPEGRDDLPWQVVRADAIVHMPQQGTTNQRSHGHRQQISFERVRMDHIDVSSSQASGQPDEEAQRSPRPRETPKQADVSSTGRRDRCVELDHMCLHTAATQPIDQRTRSKAEDDRLEAIAVHRVDQPLERNLRATERCGVRQQRDSRDATHDRGTRCVIPAPHVVPSVTCSPSPVLNLQWTTTSNSTECSELQQETLVRASMPAPTS